MTTAPPYAPPPGWTVSSNDRPEVYYRWIYCRWIYTYKYYVIIRKDSDAVYVTPRHTPGDDDTQDVEFPSFEAAVAAVTLMEGA